MSPALAVFTAAMSTLSAALAAVLLAYIQSMDRRVAALESHYINRRGG